MSLHVEICTRIPIQSAFVDPLNNTGQSKQIVGNIEVPVRNRVPACHFTVDGLPFRLDWDATFGELVGVGYAFVVIRVGTMVTKVTQWMAQGRKFPVEDRNDAWLGWMDQNIADSVVTVDHPRGVIVRDVFRHPLNQFLHLWNIIGLCTAILLRPTINLPRKVVSRPAVFLKSHRNVIDLMQVCEHANEILVDSPTFLGFKSDHLRRCDPSFNLRHDVEGLTNDGFVITEQQHFRHRHVAVA